MSCDMNCCDSSTIAHRDVSRSWRIPFHASLRKKEKIKRGSSVSHSWEWKVLTDTRLCIPSGATPPHMDHISPPGDRPLQILAIFSASSTESGRIMTNTNKLRTNCSVGCCSTAKRCKLRFFFFKSLHFFLLEIHLINLNILFCRTPPRMIDNTCIKCYVVVCW